MNLKSTFYVYVQTRVSVFTYEVEQKQKTASARDTSIIIIITYNINILLFKQNRDKFLCTLNNLFNLNNKHFLQLLLYWNINKTATIHIWLKSVQTNIKLHYMKEIFCTFSSQFKKQTKSWHLTQAPSGASVRTEYHNSAYMTMESYTNKI